MLFEETVANSREHNFLNEKIWKKLDSLAEAVNSSERFAFGNKNTLQLEKLTSVILECGGDEAEALSAAFLCKIVPLLKVIVGVATGIAAAETQFTLFSSCSIAVLTPAR